MKPSLQTSLGQHLALTPQLRQALHLLQLSSLELEAEIVTAVESNPLLEWNDGVPASPGEEGMADHPSSAAEHSPDPEAATDWAAETDTWSDPGSGSGSYTAGNDFDPSEHVAHVDDLREHLSWQLNLSPLSPRDHRIGEALIDAIDDQGYLRAPFSDISAALEPEMSCSDGEILTVLRQIQHMDPVGVGARDLRECLQLQLDALPADTPCLEFALRIVDNLIEELPRLGVAGLCAPLNCDMETAETAFRLLRSLDPHPGSRIGASDNQTYLVPDCIIERHEGVWRVRLSSEMHTRLGIHQGYERMIGHASESDTSYLRSHLQEARWLLKSIRARGETLLKVARCLVRQQSGFLEFGPQALRPLTLREVADEIQMHESTVSRAISRKYAHTPRGTLPLRSFFASGVNAETGAQASSTAIQHMIRTLVDGENPRKPLSDARLAAALKDAGIPVARRTVTKYREAINIPSSHERVRVS